MAFLEAYFDETATAAGDSGQVVGVAGFLFTKDACLSLDLKWKEVLDRYSLPYFHMVDCAHHNPPFDKLSLDECIAVEKEMIAIIRSYLLLGTSFSVPESEYNELFPDHRPYGSAYTYCCWTCLSVIWHWIIDTNFDGEISYFFEAGHVHQPEANKVMNMIFGSPDLRSAYRYGAHAFVPKIKSRPVQAADLLAWLSGNQAKRVLSGNATPRKDLVALLEDRPIDLKFARRRELEIMKRQTVDLFSEKPLISGMFGRVPFVSS